MAGPKRYNHGKRLLTHRVEVRPIWVVLSWLALGRSFRIGL